MQSFDTQIPSAEWMYVFPKSKKNENGKSHQLHVTASKYYIFHEIQIPIAESDLKINITSKLTAEIDQSCTHIMFFTKKQ